MMLDEMAGQDDQTMNVPGTDVEAAAAPMTTPEVQMAAPETPGVPVTAPVVPEPTPAMPVAAPAMYEPTAAVTEVALDAPVIDGVQERGTAPVDKAAPVEGDSLDADDDGIFAAEFDAMFKARYVAALVSAGPSLAMEDRILQNLLDAQAGRDEALAAGEDPAEVAGSTGVIPAQHANKPDVQAAAAAAAHAATPAHLELVPNSPAEAASTTSLEDAATTLGGRASRFLRRLPNLVGPEHRTLQIAAAALAALLVVGVARGLTGVVTGGSSKTAAPEPPALVEMNEERSSLGAADTMGYMAAEESADWMPTACPNIDLSTGEHLVVVFGEKGRPEEVDPTVVGEFVETAKAYGSEGKLACEVFHIIAQSAGDGGLYAVSFVDDGAFYLARPL